MDDDGYIYFKSRSKELVIRGGVNVYPVGFFHTFINKNFQSEK
jgi:hypothetical protein